MEMKQHNIVLNCLLIPICAILGVLIYFLAKPKEYKAVSEVTIIRNHPEKFETKKEKENLSLALIEITEISETNAVAELSGERTKKSLDIHVEFTHPDEEVAQEAKEIVESKFPDVNLEIKTESTEPNESQDQSR